mmetsp:Transcript_40227/g.79492  ORF Transcript_40227/g.79492 Transcript_40227/m.79492 type:complete len:376 (-) Transcript_40227:101-1228(-)
MTTPDVEVSTLALADLWRQSKDLCHMVLVFLEVPCSCHVATTARSVTQSCFMNGKLVTGLLFSRGFSSARLLPYVDLPSVRALTMQGPNAELGVVVLAIISTEWRQLQHIALRSETISTDLWGGFVRALVEAKNRIKSLTLHDCRLRGGPQSMVNFLKTDGALTNFGLRGCQLQDDTAAMILHALKEHRTVTAIDMSSNSLGLASGDEIVSLLSCNCRVSKLHLANNNLGYKARSIFENLAENVSIDTFDFAGNSQSSSHIGHACLGMLQQNTRLKTLSLADCKLLEEGAKHVVIGLRANSTLTSLSLAGNGLSIGASGRQQEFAAGVADELALTLDCNSTIRHLDLERNSSHRLDLSKLCKALAQRAKPFDLRL